MQGPSTPPGHGCEGSACTSPHPPDTEAQVAGRGGRTWAGVPLCPPGLAPGARLSHRLVGLSLPFCAVRGQASDPRGRPCLNLHPAGPSTAGRLCCSLRPGWGGQLYALLAAGSQPCVRPLWPSELPPSQERSMGGCAGKSLF